MPKVPVATQADVDDLAALAIELHPVRWAAGSDATELRVDCWEFERGPEPFYRREGFQTVKREMSRRVGG